MANPNNVIHRRRAARNEVKEARTPENLGGDPTTPTPEPVATKKRRSFKKKK